MSCNTFVKIGDYIVRSDDIKTVNSLILWDKMGTPKFCIIVQKIQGFVIGHRPSDIDNITINFDTKEDMDRALNKAYNDLNN